MPVKTKGRPLPLERYFAKKALRHAIGDEENIKSPIEPNMSNLVLGAKIYLVQCAVCHGLPQSEPSAIAKGLFPKPPQLMPPHKGVTDDQVGETYWKVKNGIRLTGMPGFIDNLSENEMWQVSEFLFNADKLPTEALDVFKNGNKK